MCQTPATVGSQRAVAQQTTQDNKAIQNLKVVLLMSLEGFHLFLWGMLINIDYLRSLFQTCLEVFEELWNVMHVYQVFMGYVWVKTLGERSADSALLVRVSMSPNGFRIKPFIQYRYI